MDFPQLIPKVPISKTYNGCQAELSNLPGKPVDNPACRGRVKEAHRGSQDLLEERVMKADGGLDRAEGHDHNGYEGEEALETPKYPVESEVKVPPRDVGVGFPGKG